MKYDFRPRENLDDLHELWLAVLDRALKDAFCPDEHTHPHERLEAQRWLEYDAKGKQYVCQNAGLSPEWFELALPEIEKKYRQYAVEMGGFASRGVVYRQFKQHGHVADKILEIVATYYGRKASDIKSKFKYRSDSKARQVSSWAIYKLTPMRGSAIAHVLNWSRQSIDEAVRTTNSRRSSPEFKEETDKILEMCKKAIS